MEIKAKVEVAGWMYQIVPHGIKLTVVIMLPRKDAHWLRMATWQPNKRPPHNSGPNQIW